MTSIARLFKGLEGCWRLNRNIPNRGIVSGLATFMRVNPTTLHYHEVGKMKLDGFENSMDVTRSYWYAYTSDDDIKVYFDSELSQLFQALKFDESVSRATSSHLCIADTYDATYQFALPTTFSIRYKVLGPEKDYYIETTYEKQDPDD